MSANADHARHQLSSLNPRVGFSGSTVKISDALLSCFDVHDVETQHLPWHWVIHHACNDLLPIRCDLAIINLSIVAIRDPNDNS